jgi:hypothetical protein
MLRGRGEQRREEREAFGRGGTATRYQVRENIRVSNERRHS